jgi:hypothetical protein
MIETSSDVVKETWRRADCWALSGGTNATGVKEDLRMAASRHALKYYE